MFDGDLELTIEEEEKIQNPANIYSLIRTLQFIEWAYNFSHIDRESYTKETNIILEQYKNATNAYNDYNYRKRKYNDYIFKTEVKKGIKSFYK